MTAVRSETPMMRQYQSLKAQAPGALLLFRMGDFYELFLEDAERAAPLLDLVLTSRDKDAADPIPMCGIPHHAAETYIRRLLDAGERVAIAEQVEDPRFAKGLVRREIVEVVSPGLVANPARLAGPDANYLAAFCADGAGCGLAYVDVSTGEFAAALLADASTLAAELARLRPREILARDADKSLGAGVPVRALPDAEFDARAALERVGRLPHGLGAGETGADARAAAALWITVAQSQASALEALTALRRYRAADGMILDPSTRRHLELAANLQDGGRSGTLLETLDRTRTPMGRRLLAAWIGEPLLDPAAIGARQERLAEWLEPDSRRHALGQSLRGVGDLDRQLTRVCLPTSAPHDFAHLRSALGGALRVHAIASLAEAGDAPGGEPGSFPGAPLLAELERTLVDDPPAPPRGEPHTGYVRDGVDAELDRIRAEAVEGQRFLETLEVRERERTGLARLRVKYNRVFGYSIEVGRAQSERVPPEYRRKQTTASAERFTTDELERWEVAVRRGRELAAAAEARVLEELRACVRAQSAPIRRVAARIAELDVFQSLAQVAREHDYTRPEIDLSRGIEIEAGRHPVAERFTPDGFVPNDVQLDPQGASFAMLTGPNMAGKSTLLRQVGLIALLAQMGSWVPARRARIGIVDRIFTRVGASDSLRTGESTFMVEMRETAAILGEATERSLLLLDEIGRGTSTFDGLSIAWAVAEYLHDTPGLRPRTLFATHYHELADLARTRPGVRNFHFACAERGGEILFLRRMEPGAASRSYGIEVARHAGLPPEVIRRAREVLGNLEGGEFDDSGRPRIARGARSGPPAQLDLFAATPDRLRVRLREIEPGRMTPIEALVELDRLKREAEDG